MLLRCYDGVSGSIIILLRSLAFSDFIRTFATMNKNINLKIVWALCGVAILLLFCTQAYWLYNQYQYSLDKTVDQFKEDCDKTFRDVFKTYKLQADKGHKKHTFKTKIETKFDTKKVQKAVTTLSFWDNKKYLGKVQKIGITSDDAYELYSRYAAFREHKLTAATYQPYLDKKRYGKIEGFRQVKYPDVFLDSHFEVTGQWTRTVTVRYQTNPMFRQGIAFEVMMSPVPVLRSMLWQLIGSLLLFVILVGCLYYLVKTIVVQKRIDAIRHAFLKNMIYEMKQPSNNKNSDESAISIGSIAFYYTQNELRCAHERVIVTSRQAEILRMLATHPNQLVERESILNEVWGDDSYSNSLALNVQITYLRRALSSDASVSIEAVIKKGYILRTPTLP